MAQKILSPQAPRQLTAAEIETLAQRPCVSPPAVRRFLRQLDLSLSRAEHTARALSATLLTWATANAIIAGIDLVYLTQGARCRESRDKE